MLNYLALAEDEDGNQPFKCLSSLSNVTEKSIDYDFWPRWKEADCYGCEPDVVISLKIPDGNDLLVLIEAKYSSPKSSEADESHEKPNDQLAKEWDNLIVRPEASNKSPVLIYLTAHYVHPYEDINDAINEFLEKRPEGARPVIYWVSWRHLYKICKNTGNPILKDLTLLLDRLNFKFFDGIKLEDLHIPWSFVKDLDDSKLSKFGQSSGDFNVSNTGKQILQSTQKFRDYLKDIGTLLTTAEGMLKKQGFETCSNKAVDKDSTASIESPEWWLLYDAFRFLKHRDNIRLLVVISVIIDFGGNEVSPEQPIVSAAWYKYKEESSEHNWNYSFSRNILKLGQFEPDGRMIPIPPDRITHIEEGAIASCEALAVPLVKIVSPKDIEEKIITPLLESLNC